MRAVQKHVLMSRMTVLLLLRVDPKSVNPILQFYTIRGRSIMGRPVLSVPIGLLGTTAGRGRWLSNLDGCRSRASHRQASDRKLSDAAITQSVQSINVDQWIFLCCWYCACVLTAGDGLAGF